MSYANPISSYISSSLTLAESDGVWHQSSNNKNISYSNDAAAESYLMNTLKNVKDLASDSDELQCYIRDWNSFYNLSRIRSNLIRSLSIYNNNTVLEIGAGCGAITRYFSENTEKVVAVEGNERRAQICKIRCRDKKNVEVIAADAFSLDYKPVFDVVTLIGILEYGNMYSKTNDKHNMELIEICANAMRPGGVLVVAIENQFGIKYFSGCREDHKVTLFEGVEGYPNNSGIRNFGKNRLVELINTAGLAIQEVLLPFPDYKIPKTIIHEDKEKQSAINKMHLDEWCREMYSNYSTSRSYLFDDHLALAEFAANGSLADVANSFLIVARKGEVTNPPIPQIDWIARRYNLSRHPAYQTITELRMSSEKLPVITKTRHKPTPNVFSEGRLIQQLGVSESYFENAESMALCMVRALRRNDKVEETFASLLFEWLRFLASQVVGLENSDQLPGSLLDCIPDNLIRTPDGQWHFVDQEWIYHETLPRKLILFRGLLVFWHRQPLANIPLEYHCPLEFEEFASRCFKLVGLSLSLEELDRFWKFEVGLQSQVGKGVWEEPKVTPTSHFRRPLTDRPLSGRRELVIHDQLAGAPFAMLSLPVLSTRLFFDLGHGFREEDSISHTIRGDEKEFCFYILRESPVRSLRFHPLNVRSVIRIQALLLTNEAETDVRTVDLQTCTHNAVILSSGEFFFDNSNPQIVITLENWVDLQRLVFRGEVVAIGQGVEAYLLQVVRNELCKQKADCEARESQLQTQNENQKRELDTLGTRIAQGEEEIMAITRKKETLEKELVNVKTNCEELEKERKLLIQTQKRYQNENQELIHSLDERAKEVIIIKQQNNDFLAALERNNLHTTELERSLTEFLRWKGQAIVRIGGLERQLAHSQQSLQTLELQFQRITYSAGYRLVQQIRANTLLFKTYTRLVKPLARWVREKRQSKS